MSHRPTPAQADQLRRDAKRLARANGLSHAKALDETAQRHGFQNWSLLARRIEPAGDGDATAFAAAPAAPAAPAFDREPPRATAADARTGPTDVRWEATRDELRLIRQIVDRFEALAGPERRIDRLSLMMDLEAVHCTSCALDLEGLLHAPRDLDLAHDVAGIAQHIDRTTGQLTDFFRPRYSAQR